MVPAHRHPAGRPDPGAAGHSHQVHRHDLCDRQLRELGATVAGAGTAPVGLAVTAGGSEVLRHGDVGRAGRGDDVCEPGGRNAYVITLHLADESKILGRTVRSNASRLYTVKTPELHASLEKNSLEITNCYAVSRASSDFTAPGIPLQKNFLASLSTFPQKGSPRTQRKVSCASMAA